MVGDGKKKITFLRPGFILTKRRKDPAKAGTLIVNSSECFGDRVLGAKTS